jgi:hypothetical protein
LPTEWLTPGWLFAVNNLKGDTEPFGELDRQLAGWRVVNEFPVKTVGIVDVLMEVPSFEPILVNGLHDSPEQPPQGDHHLFVFFIEWVFE